MEEFTKGPWESLDTCVRVNRPGDWDHHIIICEVSRFLTGGKPEARLIAAAPDLLEALKEAILQIEYLHEKFSPTGSGEAVLAKAKTAIARAGGA